MSRNHKQNCEKLENLRKTTMVFSGEHVGGKVDILFLLYSTPPMSVSFPAQGLDLPHAEVNQPKLNYFTFKFGPIPLKVIPALLKRRLQVMKVTGSGDLTDREFIGLCA